MASFATPARIRDTPDLLDRVSDEENAGFAVSRGRDSSRIVPLQLALGSSSYKADADQGVPPPEEAR